MCHLAGRRARAPRWAWPFGGSRPDRPGVGGLAVALALQDTLSNFFAGLHLLIEQPIRVGDFIKLETGQEGIVEDISWRTTRIRMPSNDLVILPNSKLTQSVVTNYSLPDPRRSTSLSVQVPPDTDVERVERLLVEEASKAAGRLPGLWAEPPPSAQLVTGFGGSPLEFSLAVSIRDYADQHT